MRAAWATMSAFLLAGMLGGCGPSNRTDGTDKTTGVRVTLNGTTAAMGEIIVQNVFDPSQTQLLTCAAKDHTLNGLTFCDEMLVVPPGVYEVKVELQDATCKTEFDHYKTVVNAGQTSEISINVICGATNGGLDVIVKEVEAPIVTDVNFTFAGSGEPANKYVCQCGEPVTVTTHVFDSDNICVDLTGTWTATNSAGAPVTPLLLIPGTPAYPDMTLFDGAFDVNNASNPATFTLNVTGTNVPASWTDASGNPVGAALVDWSLTWNAATQTGALTVTDTSTSTTLLTGTVNAMAYNLTTPAASVFFGDVMVNANTLGFPTNAVIRWAATADLTVDPGNPNHLTGTGLADLFPWRWPGNPECTFFMSIDTAVALGLYHVNFTVSDPTGLSNSFEVPIHVIDCGLCPP